MPIEELGVKGMIKMSFRLMIRPDLLRAMTEYYRIFKDCADYIEYGYVVGMKQ